MSNSAIRILNFDGSVASQGKLIQKYSPTVIDLLKFGPRARLWAGRKISRQIEEAIPQPCGNTVNFIGSGDFHHISALLINKIRRPLTLIIFDFHPDWAGIPPLNSCGSWVRLALKNKNIAKCVVLGASSDDISTLGLYSADTGLLKKSRLEIYPYSRRPSRIFFRGLPANVSFRAEKNIFSSTIYWDELKQKGARDFVGQLSGRISQRDVYISVDKDCLKKEYALTNWEQGQMPLEELLAFLRLVKSNFNLLGVDITGDYSPICLRGLAKTLISGLDHPRKFSAKDLSPAQITAVNEETNLRILEALL